MILVLVFIVIWYLRDKRKILGFYFKCGFNRNLYKIFFIWEGEIMKIVWFEFGFVGSEKYYLLRNNKRKIDFM